MDVSSVPDSKPPMPRRPWLIALLVGLAILSVVCVVGPMISMMWAMLGPPRKAEPSDVAQNVREKEVSAPEFGLKGTLVIDGRESLMVIDASTGHRREVLPRHEPWAIWAVAGPDGAGHVLVCENDMMAKRHRVSVVDLSTDRVRRVFERKGDAIWEDSIGENMAVSDRSTVGAVLIGTGRHEQLRDPSAYMTLSEVETVDLETAEVKRFRVQAYEGTIALDPTGRYVYFVGPGEGEMQGWLGSPGNTQPPEFSSTRRQPVVCRLDAANGSTSPVYPGWNVAPVLDGSGVVVFGYDGQRTLVDVKTGKTFPLEYPDYVESVFAFLTPRIAVGTAKQARLEDVRFTTNNGLPGPRPMPRIIAIDTDRSQLTTLAKAIDVRDNPLFGTWSQPKANLLSR